MRFVRTLTSLGFVVAGAAIVAVALAAFMTATGRSVPVMRMAAARAGELLSGQTIEQMDLHIVVDPPRGVIEGVARLRVRAQEGRQRLYFLLNDGLRIEAVWLESADGERRDLRHSRLWVLSAVDLEAPLAAGDSATLGIAYAGDPNSGLLPLGDRILEPDEVILFPNALWYPTDRRSFAQISVAVSLPRHLTPVHGGGTARVTDLGTDRRHAWALSRPVPGLALVAGRYRANVAEDAGVAFEALVAPDIDLDPKTLARSMSDAFATIGEQLGSPGSSHLSLFVSRRLRRPLADGSGVFGLGPGAFTGGDYGFASIAESMARNWWGGAVAADPTRPQDGGTWLIEGLAADGARAAVRARFGEDAELRWRAARAFDPTSPGALVDFSDLDAEIDGPHANPLQQRAVFAVAMLRERAGDSEFEAGARLLLERFKVGHVGLAEAREIFSEATPAELKEFFDLWISGDGSLDLSVDPSQGQAMVVNNQATKLADEVELWRMPSGGQPLIQAIAVGGTTPVGNAERLVVDPRGLLPDMYRFNNVLPREDGPRSISRSERGSWMVVVGEPHPWAPARVREIDGAGHTRHEWEFDRGLLTPASWSADGTYILAAEPARGSTAKLFALHPSDGRKVDIGDHVLVAGGSAGYAAARGSHLIWVEGKKVRALESLDSGVVGQPALSPDGALIAYTAQRGGRVELRVRPRTGNGVDRLLATWFAAPAHLVWSADGTRLFAVLPGDWDWQLWEIPLDDAPRSLMREAAGVRGVAVSPDGRRIAVAAQGTVDYRFEKYDVFIIDRTDPGAVERHTAAGQSVIDLAWRDDQSLFLITSDPNHRTIPAQRHLARLDLADGSVTPVP